jgi:hypothetical protein
MDSVEYEFIKSRLNEPKDVEFLHEQMGLSKDMLYNILGRKIVRQVMRDFYKIKKKEGLLLRRWLKGESFVEIADDINFPPVLTTSFILQKKGFTKKGVQRFITNPDLIGDKRMKREMKQAVKKDFIYSPWATDIQGENGRKGEEKIERWLQKKNLKFITEREGKFTYEKTPDFLLRSPLSIMGHEAKWIESKASFGSPNEIKRNYKKQLKPYLDLFGPGVVVYWYGFVDDVDINKNILMINDAFFRKKA